MNATAVIREICDRLELPATGTFGGGVTPSV